MKLNNRQLIRKIFLKIILNLTKKTNKNFKDNKKKLKILFN